MKLELKALRARGKTKVTQEQLAATLNLTQSQVSRYEDGDPEDIPYRLLKTWLKALGESLDNFEHDAEQVAALQPGDVFQSVRHRLDLLVDYVGARNVPEREGLPGPQALLELVSRLRRKPNLALVGQFDAGKSRLANGLLGGEHLLARYQPTTSLITHIRHISDRPAWMPEDVWLMKAGFDPSSEVEEHWVEHRVLAGNLRTLRDHGTHAPDGRATAPTEARMAIVYLDSPLLMACNLVDSPGFRGDQSHGERGAAEDAERALDAMRVADALIFASTATGFLSGGDLAYLGMLLRSLRRYEEADSEFPLLGNLFIVATHAHRGIRDEQLNDILDGSARRLYHHFCDTVFRDRAEACKRDIDFESFRSRFFHYWEDNEARREPLRQALTVTLREHIPRATRKVVVRELEAFKSGAAQQTQDALVAYGRVLQDIDRARDQLRKLEAEEGKRRELVSRRKAAIETKLGELRAQSADDCTRAYVELTHVDALTQLIAARYGGKANAKEEAKNMAASYVLEQLQSRIAADVRGRAEAIFPEIEALLGAYSASVDAFGDSHEGGRLNIPFDARASFLGGMVGAGAVGALGMWAATLGNLGGYIIAAKLASVLAALGVGLPGGTATVVSLLAAIGGPITVAVGIIALGALVGYALFGESWEQRLAKRIVKSFEESHLLEKLTRGTNDYWEQTSKAFQAGAARLEHDYQDHMARLQKVLHEPGKSKSQIEAQVAELERLNDFFVKMPVVLF